MTKEEYIKLYEEDDEFAPGWDAIHDEFDRLYPDGKEDHYATLLNARAWLGGDSYLDGYSVYKGSKEYYHIVSYGMSELYANPDAFGGEYSKWGYEMTMKLKEENIDECLWVMDMMSNLARYTYTTGSYFTSNDFVVGNGTPIRIGADSQITGLIIINDTSAKTLETVHGKVEFLQLVGVTTQEIDAIREDYSNLEKLIELMKQDNPEMITDLNRNFSYI